MPRGGRIAVAGSALESGDIEITVADEGTGIPPDNLERIFTPFFTTKGRRGTGLGLSAAAGLMRRLGGGIEAENRPGGGATFKLRFPPARTIPAPPAPRTRTAEPEPPPRTRRILVVDDDPDNLDAMQLVLQHHGHVVEVTQSGLDAVARVQAGERYDTVICDLALGDSVGWEVASSIGAIAPGTRILLVTGWADEIPPADPRRRYVARVLAKPLGAEELQEILDAPAEEPATPARRDGEVASGVPSPERVTAGRGGEPPPRPHR
jgi:CheY-like chemotaxis protein